MLINVDSDDIQFCEFPVSRAKNILTVPNEVVLDFIP